MRIGRNGEEWRCVLNCSVWIILLSIKRVHIKYDLIYGPIKKGIIFDGICISGRFRGWKIIVERKNNVPMKRKQLE